MYSCLLYDYSRFEMNRNDFTYEKIITHCSRVTEQEDQDLRLRRGQALSKQATKHARQSIFSTQVAHLQLTVYFLLFTSIVAAWKNYRDLTCSAGSCESQKTLK
ncbi:unnamed protein product [Amoebophrya sp. A120]|nr:unnamed protein product [Amoebophrya sp. A120]|eukprot:GSA120T00007513001.1